MQREFYCHDCGLFFWDSIDYVSQFSYSYYCPECNKKEGIVLAVDTMGYVYFAQSRQEEINQKSWSSSKYAPEFAIKHYEMQKMKIR